MSSVGTFESLDIDGCQVEILEQDRKRDGPPSAPSSVNGSEADEDEEDTLCEEELESIPASQEEEEIDIDGLMPNELEGHSPADDMKSFNWADADDELAEFLDESGDESDSSSVTSENTTRGTKRDRASDDEDSDDGSVTTKKQRISKTRHTGLNNVLGRETAGGEDSVSNGHDVQNGSDDSDDDLEKDIEAAFAAEEEREAEDGAD